MSRRLSCVAQIGRLWDDFALGMPIPVPPQTEPLRATLEPVLPAALSEFLIHRLLAHPLSQPGAVMPAGEFSIEFGYMNLQGVTFGSGSGSSDQVRFP